jgi:ubiquitin-protein ligase
MITNSEIQKEYDDIGVFDPIDGFMLDEESNNNFCFGTLEGAIDSIFEGAYLRIKIDLTNYSKGELKVFFIDIIFHPHVNFTTGEVCIHPIAEAGKYITIRDTINCLQNFLLYPNSVTNGLNPEANDLCRNNKPEYERRALEVLKKFKYS